MVQVILTKSWQKTLTSPTKSTRNTYWSSFR